MESGFSELGHPSSARSVGQTSVSMVDSRGQRPLWSLSNEGFSVENPLYGRFYHRLGSLSLLQPNSGLWSQEEKSLHINVLEMKAVLLAVSAFLPQMRDQEICLATDNSTVVAYINNQGCTKYQTLCSLSRELLLFCQKSNILLLVRHVPGKLNVLADTLTRARKPVLTEWNLSLPVFNSVCLFWDHPYVDLFVTSLKYRLPTFVSPVPDEKL